MKLLFLATALLGLLALPAAAAGLTVGQAFPELTLPTAEDHQPLSTASLNGQKAMIHLFASW